MPDKDFEEQVRERLGELSLEPSVTTRANVLQAVRQRRRRRAFFWIPALLGVLLVGAWGAFQWGGFQGLRGAFRGHRGGDAAVAPSARTSSAARSAATPGTLASVARSGTASATPGPPATARSATAAAPAEGRFDLALSAEGGPIQTGSPDWTDRVRRPGQMPKPKGAFRKWSIRIYGGAGLTDQGAFGSFRTPAGDKLVTIPLTPSTGVGSVGSPGTTYKDSLAGVKAMAGFQLGVQVEFPLSNDLRWGVGLEYDFLKTRIGPVGPSPLYSALTGYNVGGTYATNYDNRYGLLSVPLDLTWDIPRLHSLGLSVGLVPAYLVSVHALEYNPQGEGYVAGKDYFHRWRLSGAAALSLDFWHFRGWALSGGPFFRYDFQNLQRNAPVPDHLNSLELRLALSRSFKK